MRLANPIYDVVFKYLMEDTEIARQLLGKIIGEEITHITVRPQEYSSQLIKHGITIYRLDFNATIITSTGETKKVLIELQKAKHQDDLMRFRRYLGDNYRKEDEIINSNGKIEKIAFPIITIYFLGFPMPPIETSILKVNRVYKDLITNQELKVRTEFIEKLTHDSYIILIPKLPPHERTDLERVLKVFNQSYKLESDDKLLQISDDEILGNDLLAMIADRLRKAATDEDVLRGIEIEEEIEEKLDKHVRENAEIKEELERVKKELEALKKQLKK